MFLPRIEDRRTRMLLRKSLQGAGIETRHSVCDDFFASDWFDIEASTAQRNEYFAKHARTLATELGKTILEKSTQFDAADITHVVFATCTGFTNPGPDFHLVQDLGLSANCQRSILGFMGCYSAVPALKTAAQLCEADADATVLVVCLELCSLHLKFSNTYDSILGNSLFGDGAGAAIVSSRTPDAKATHAARFDSFHSDIIPEGEPDMAWEIGDKGFDLVLSKRVPKILEQGVKRIMIDDAAAGDLSQIDHWAIHPGGKGILEKFCSALELDESELESSYNVLKNYGNMAGATLFFVLEEILEKANPSEKILATAFGPGLTVEAAMLESV